MEDNQEVEESNEEIRDPKAVLEALERAKIDAKKYREELNSMKVDYENTIKELNETKSTFIKEKLVQEINKTGLPNSERLLKYINVEEISLDEDKNIVGFQEQFENLKNDFPELFNPKLLVGGKADSADNQPAEKPMSASEKQARFILGKL